ncbi:MAG: hypothetical protein JRF33_12420 [Deltaproteobacteria bacterium]|nr:hypothetical protein [Deltaproteobacteria bacterium]
MVKAAFVLFFCFFLSPAQADSQKTVGPEEAWRKACSELEELSAYRPFSFRPRVIDALLSWVEEGKWEEVGGGGMGCFEPRPGLLSRVTKDAVWYAGDEVSLKIRCRWVTVETSPCIGGGKRVCRHCRSLRVEVLQARHLRQFPGEVTMRQSGSKPLDCSAPCPKNSLIETRDRLNQYLEGKEFFSPEASGEGPVLFRSLKACRRHRSKTSGSPAETSGDDGPE